MADSEVAEQNITLEVEETQNTETETNPEEESKESVDTEEEARGDVGRARRCGEAGIRRRRAYGRRQAAEGEEVQVSARRVRRGPGRGVR